MTTSTHLRQVAARTGLDSIAEALREGANTIEQHEATIARQDAGIKLLEGEVAQAHEARKQAQAQSEDYKGALTRAEHKIERLQAVEKAAGNVLGWIEASHRPPVRDVFEFGRGVSVRLHALADLQTAIDAARKDTK